MKHRIILFACALLALVANVAHAEKTVEERLKELEKKVQQAERDQATDRVKFTGDLRFEAHSIDADMPDHIDGMGMQADMVPAIWMAMHPGADFADPTTRLDYLDYVGHLTYEQFQQDMGMVMSNMTPEQIGGFQQMLAQQNYQPGYEADNDILYTTRLRLNMAADVADNVSFAGRLAMYKPWGDSSGIQVFNGQSNSLNIDGTTTSVPNSDILRVDRAYFDWKHIGGLPVYLSIGRRPSAGGPPLHLRQDEPRGGTPLGTVIDFQFDGITAGWHVTESSTVRLCYGVGYESGFGSAEQLRLPADRLKDTHFLGINWDILNTEQNYLQGTVARAFDVPDGFNGVVVLPDNPVTGQPVGAPLVMRYTPTANLGNINLASLLAMRTQGSLEAFASFSYMESDPYNVTTPFGGLFCDPYQTPENHHGSMAYVGARYSLPNERTKIGAEFNHGTKYWFNFANAADDIIAPKTNTRGDVWEFYVTHRIAPKFLVKLDYINYAYDFSGSGWHVGAPKALDETPVLGYPTYSRAGKLALSFMTRF